MPLTVGGNAADRATIESWLRQICWRVTVNPATGAVGFRPGPPGANPKTSGCDCIEQLVTGPRTATIQPLPGPGSTIPGTGSPGTTIGTCGGGATTEPPGGTVKPNGSPGQGPDGRPGGDATVYIDMSNNSGAGYPPTKCPDWLVLAHELTSGHAFHMTRGTHAVTLHDGEVQAITSENTHAEEHGITPHPMPQPPPPPAEPADGDGGSKDDGGW